MRTVRSWPRSSRGVGKALAFTTACLYDISIARIVCGVYVGSDDHRVCEKDLPPEYAGDQAML